ncbi:MAG: arylsulfatase [bacterium]|nr:arylsulfatase [bacterium]
MIDRREFLQTSALALAGLSAGLPAARRAQARNSAAAPAKRPNFLVIIADDMGFSDAGCYGGEIVTPNLDRLAQGGVRFTQFYSTGRCWPSRSCLMTGYYAQQIRMDPPQGRLPSWARLAPHYLKPLGYRSYHSGKWHVMGAPDPVRDGGFDRSYPSMGPEHKQMPINETDDSHWTIPVASNGIGFLKEHAREHPRDPFFLYLAFTAPHFPLIALQEDIDRYKGRYDEGWDVIRERRWRNLKKAGMVNHELPKLEPETIPSWNISEEELKRQIGPGEVGRAVPWATLTDEQKKFQALKMQIHAAMIDRMDREIGRVLDQVRAVGAVDNTVVMFVSDNGASAEQMIRGTMHDPALRPGAVGTYLCLGPGWSSSSNSPFRLHKSWVHEGGISSPLIIHWPAGLKTRGELRHNPGHFTDLLPTMLELARATPEPEWHGQATPPLAGRSLAPVLAMDNSVPHPEIYFHHIENRAMRVGDWKLVSKGQDGPWELYDLKTDRGESHDLAAAKPVMVKDLAALWQRREDEYRQLAGPPQPLNRGTKKARKSGETKTKRQSA